MQREILFWLYSTLLIMFMIPLGTTIPPIVQRLQMVAFFFSIACSIAFLFLNVSGALVAPLCILLNTAVSITEVITAKERKAP